MVEVAEHTGRVRAQEVVVADVQRARHVQDLRTRRRASPSLETLGAREGWRVEAARTHDLDDGDELQHGQGVEDGDSEQRVEVAVGARPQRALAPARQLRQPQPRRQTERALFIYVYRMQNVLHYTDDFKRTDSFYFIYLYT